MKGSGIDKYSVRVRKVLRPVGVWVLLAIFAVINGVFRELVIVPATGISTGHLFSTVSLITVVLIISYAYFGMVNSTEFTLSELLVVGLIWSTLTVVFEFFVAYFEGVGLSGLLAQYDVTAGRIWILVPVTLLIAPLVFGYYTQRQG